MLIVRVVIAHAALLLSRGRGTARERAGWVAHDRSASRFSTRLGGFASMSRSRRRQVVTVLLGPFSRADPLNPGRGLCLAPTEGDRSWMTVAASTTGARRRAAPFQVRLCSQQGRSCPISRSDEPLMAAVSASDRAPKAVARGLVRDLRSAARAPARFRVRKNGLRRRALPWPPEGLICR